MDCAGDSPAIVDQRPRNDDGTYLHSNSNTNRNSKTAIAFLDCAGKCPAIVGQAPSIDDDTCMAPDSLMDCAVEFPVIDGQASHNPPRIRSVPPLDAAQHIRMIQPPFNGYHINQTGRHPIPYVTHHFNLHFVCFCGFVSPVYIHNAVNGTILFWNRIYELHLRRTNLYYLLSSVFKLI